MNTETYTYTKIRDTIWQIQEDDGVYCTLVRGSKLAVLVDTGFGRRDLKTFVEQNISTPYIVINSHGHPDHVGGNYRFDAVYAIKEEWDVIRHFDADRNESYTLREIKDGQRISLGDMNMEIVSMPGHTKGSVGLFVLEEKLLIAGDALNECLWLFNYGSLPIRELYQTIAAVSKLDFTSYLCGHSNKTYPKEKLRAHLKNIENLQIDENTRRNMIGFETYCSVYEDTDGRSEMVFTIDKIEKPDAFGFSVK